MTSKTERLIDETLSHLRRIRNCLNVTSAKDKAEYDIHRKLIVMIELMDVIYNLMAYDSND